MLSNQVLVIDSAREKRMLLGRSWDLPPLQRGHCYLKKNVAKAINATPGDTVVLGIYLFQTGLYNLMEKALNGEYKNLNSTYMWIPFIVDDIYKNPKV